jgi:predicted nucleic acid-binding protein
VTYFDTGYLAKCYLEEPGSVAVRELAGERERIACSAYGRMELLAAFHRKLREKSLSRAQLQIVLRQLDLDEEQGLWAWLPLTNAIMASVVSIFRTLPPSVFLRTADAIHLATARSESLPEVWSGDIRLIAAAPHFGLVGRSVSAPRRAG